MPDLRPVERYIVQLGRVERQAVNDAQRIWKAARAELFDRLGFTAPALGPQIQQVIGYAADSISAAALRQVTPIAAAAQGLVQAQTGQAVFDSVAAPGMGLIAWQSATNGLFLAELSRLNLIGADEQAIAARLITGADGRQSVYDQARVGLELLVAQAIWATGNGHVARLADIAGQRSGRRYQKQAIAAIDSRTTDCCLKVHGQIQDLDKPFQLSGTPRFADRVQNPPFHHRCRTATALYLEEMEAIGTSTETMRAQARAALQRRYR